MKCPFCNSSEYVIDSIYSHSKYYCVRCNRRFNDCCSIDDKPSNAKLADMALDSLLTGRYQTPDYEEGKYFEFGDLENSYVKPAMDLLEKQTRDELFRAEFERRFPSLSYEFIQTMQEIGDLGRAKYGDQCIEVRIKNGDISRGERTKAREIIRHSWVHGNDYIDGIKHDVYKTRRHQLAAMAFNPMMEFRLAELEGEPCAPLEITNR